MSCEYCKTPITKVRHEDGTITCELAGRDPEPFWDKGNIQLFIDRNKRLNVKCYIDYHESHTKGIINFCPMCGKALPKAGKHH